MRTLRTLIALAATTAALLATSAHARQPMLSVRALAVQPGDMPQLHLMGEDGPLPLAFPTSQPGATVRAVAANPLPLYVKRKDEAGNDRWVESQRVNLPSGTREILLLALPSADGTHYLAIRDNLSEAGFNDWLLINTSSRTVAFAVGENTAPVVVRPGASAIQRFNLPANEGTAVRALTPIDDRPTVFFTTFWPVRGDRRTIVLFTDEGDAIHVRRIADQLTPVP